MSQSSILFSQQVPGLIRTHFQQLHKGRGISIDVIWERAYRGVVDKASLKNLAFFKSQLQVPFIPALRCRVDSQRVCYVCRTYNYSTIINAKDHPIKCAFGRVLCGTPCPMHYVIFWEIA